MATGGGRDHVQRDQRLHVSCCHGGIAGGEQFSAAEGGGRCAGDFEVGGKDAPSRRKGASLETEFLI